MDRAAEHSVTKLAIRHEGCSWRELSYMSFTGTLVTVPKVMRHANADDETSHVTPCRGIAVHAGSDLGHLYEAALVLGPQYSVVAMLLRGMTCTSIKVAYVLADSESCARAGAVQCTDSFLSAFFCALHFQGSVPWMGFLHRQVARCQDLDFPDGLPWRDFMQSFSSCSWLPSGCCQKVEMCIPPSAFCVLILPMPGRSALQRQILMALDFLQPRPAHDGLQLLGLIADAGSSGFFSRVEAWHCCLGRSFFIVLLRACLPPFCMEHPVPRGTGASQSRRVQGSHLSQRSPNHWCFFVVAHLVPAALAAPQTSGIDGVPRGLDTDQLVQSRTWPSSSLGNDEVPGPGLSGNIPADTSADDFKVQIVLEQFQRPCFSVEH